MRRVRELASPHKHPSHRQTGATLIDAIDSDVTEMYLAHAEPGMKKAYVQRDWKRLGRALVKLEKKVPFKL